MAWLILIALTYSSCKEASENYKMKMSCSQWDSNPVPVSPAYEADALSFAPRDLVSIIG